MNLNISPEWITAIITMIGTVFAGAGLKAVDSWLSKSGAKSTVDSQLREEYRDTITDKRKDIAELKQDIEGAKREIDELEEEVHRWRNKYYEELRVKMELMSRLRYLEERFENGNK